MKRKLILLLIGLTMSFFVACSDSSQKIEEPKYESAGFEWYAFLGEWTNDNDSLEFYDDDSFYDSRYDLTGTWEKSEMEGDVVLWYNGVPEWISAQGWDEEDQYYECYSLNYDENSNYVLLDPDSKEVAWKKWE